MKTNPLKYTEGADTTQPTPTRPDAFELELIAAFQSELGNMRTRIHELEKKVLRYDRAFEAMFKEELDKRLNGNDKYGQYSNQTCEISPLESLKYKADKMQQRTGLSG